VLIRALNPRSGIKVMRLRFCLLDVKRLSKRPTFLGTRTLVIRSQGNVRHRHAEEQTMTVRCSVSTDEGPDNMELDFVQIPRFGEGLDIAVAEGIKSFRVTRVVHRVGPSASPSVLLEVTSKIL
jgi:hypothetical protein